MAVLTVKGRGAFTAATATAVISAFDSGAILDAWTALPIGADLPIRAISALSSAAVISAFLSGATCWAVTDAFPIDTDLQFGASRGGLPRAFGGALPDILADTLLVTFVACISAGAALLVALPGT